MQGEPWALLYGTRRERRDFQHSCRQGIGEMLETGPWAVVQPYFERTTGQPLRAGMKVLLKVYPQFHEAFGFSWIVTDIDPNYTLGDMAQRRQQIIAQLKAEGVFDLQRELVIPRFCQRIAVISAATAAGYGDFCRQLEENEYGLVFYPTLFPAVMQGEQVEQSVIAALNRINGHADDYDVVVIIRGGGSTSDMSGFDTLSLAENVANFPCLSSLESVMTGMSAYWIWCRIQE